MRTATGVSITYGAVPGATSYEVTKYRGTTPLATVTDTPAGATGTLTYSLTANDLGAEAGVFKFEIVAKKGTESSDPTAVNDVKLGHPGAPSSAAIVNDDFNAADIVVEFNPPSLDIAAGYYFKLRLLRKGATDVADTANVINASKDGSTTITGALTKPSTKWRVTVPRTDLLCGAAGPCPDGKYELAEFGALSAFKADNGALAGATLTDGKPVAQASGLPLVTYYGEWAAARV